VTSLSFCQWLAETPLSLAFASRPGRIPSSNRYTYSACASSQGCCCCGICVCRHHAFSRGRVGVWARLIPWITAGTVLMVVSGLLLFASDPVRFYGNIFFRIKAAGLFLALLNALAFHFGIERRLVEWDMSAVTPRAARFAGASRSASGPRSSSPAASWPITGFHRFHNRDFTCVSRSRHTEAPRHRGNPTWSLCLNASVCRSSVISGPLPHSRQGTCSRFPSSAAQYLLLICGRWAGCSLVSAWPKSLPKRDRG
jgi:hypothetical protein